MSGSGLLEIIEAAQKDLSSSRSFQRVNECRDFPGSVVINAKNLVRVILDDKELLMEVISIFLRDYRDHLDKIREAAVRGESDVLRSAAHRLKGSLTTLSAPRALQAAMKLEIMGRSNELQKAEAALEDLETELRVLVELLGNIAARA